MPCEKKVASVVEGRDTDVVTHKLIGKGMWLSYATHDHQCPI